MTAVVGFPPGHRTAGHITHRFLNGHVPQQLLNHNGVHAARVKMRGVGVAERMRGQGFAQGVGAQARWPHLA